MLKNERSGATQSGTASCSVNIDWLTGRQTGRTADRTGPTTTTTITMMMTTTATIIMMVMMMIMLEAQRNTTMATKCEYGIRVRNINICKYVCTYVSFKSFNFRFLSFELDFP